MRSARPSWPGRTFVTVVAITTTFGAAWRWRITNPAGAALEESEEIFPTITTALAAGRRRLTVLERSEDPASPAGGGDQ